MDIFAEDINNVAAADFIPWKKLSGKTVLITGATGLIGRASDVYLERFRQPYHRYKGWSSKEEQAGKGKMGEFLIPGRKGGQL